MRGKGFEREREREGMKETAGGEPLGERAKTGNEPWQLISLGFHNALANERPL